MLSVEAIFTTAAIVHNGRLIFNTGLPLNRNLILIFYFELPPIETTLIITNVSFQHFDENLKKNLYLREEQNIGTYNMNI